MKTILTLLAALAIGAAQLLAEDPQDKFRYQEMADIRQIQDTFGPPITREIVISYRPPTLVEELEGKIRDLETQIEELESKQP